MKQYHITTSQQKAFTLVEMIIVIALLAILAAFSIARFTNTDREARVAAVKAAAGALRSAKHVVKSAYHAKAKFTQSTLTMDDGIVVSVTPGASGGLPDASANGMGKALEISSDYIVSYSSLPDLVTISVPGATGTCEATYDSDGIISVETGGC